MLAISLYLFISSKSKLGFFRSRTVTDSVKVVDTTALCNLLDPAGTYTPLELSHRHYNVEVGLLALVLRDNEM